MIDTQFQHETPEEETMETPRDDTVEKRARISLRFGLMWLIIALLALSWNWLSKGPLEPVLPGSLSQAGIALDRTLSTLTPIVFLVWVGSGVACVLTAFPREKRSRSWQGKAAAFLGVLVILCFVPAGILLAVFLIIWYGAPLWR